MIDNVAYLKYSLKCLEFAVVRRENSRVPDVLGETVPDVGAKARKSAKAIQGT